MLLYAIDQIHLYHRIILLIFLPNMASSFGKLYIAQCPRCHAVLKEISPVPLYRCRGCKSMLLVKNWKLEETTSIENDSSEKFTSKEMSGNTGLVSDDGSMLDRSKTKLEFPEVEKDLTVHDGRNRVKCEGECKEMLETSVSCSCQVNLENGYNLDQTSFNETSKLSGDEAPYVSCQTTDEDKKNLDVSHDNGKTELKHADGEFSLSSGIVYHYPGEAAISEMHAEEENGNSEVQHDLAQSSKNGEESAVLGKLDCSFSQNNLLETRSYIFEGMHSDRRDSMDANTVSSSGEDTTVTSCNQGEIADLVENDCSFQMHTLNNRSDACEIVESEERIVLNGESSLYPPDANVLDMHSDESAVENWHKDKQGGASLDNQPENGAPITFGGFEYINNGTSPHLMVAVAIEANDENVSGSFAEKTYISNTIPDKSEVNSYSAECKKQSTNLGFMPKLENGSDSCYKIETDKNSSTCEIGSKSETLSNLSNKRRPISMRTFRPRRTPEFSNMPTEPTDEEEYKSVLENGNVDMMFEAANYPSSLSSDLEAWDASDNVYLQEKTVFENKDMNPVCEPELDQDFGSTSASESCNLDEIIISLSDHDSPSRQPIPTSHPGNEVPNAATDIQFDRAPILASKDADPMSEEEAELQFTPPPSTTSSSELNCLTSVCVISPGNRESSDKNPNSDSCLTDLVPNDSTDLADKSVPANKNVAPVFKAENKHQHFAAPSSSVVCTSHTDNMLFQSDNELAAGNPILTSHPDDGVPDESSSFSVLEELVGAKKNVDVMLKAEELEQHHTSQPLMTSSSLTSPISHETPFVNPIISLDLEDITSDVIANANSQGKSILKNNDVNGVSEADLEQHFTLSPSSELSNLDIDSVLFPSSQEPSAKNDIVSSLSKGGLANSEQQKNGSKAMLKPREVILHDSAASHQLNHLSTKQKKANPKQLELLKRLDELKIEITKSIAQKKQESMARTQTDSAEMAVEAPIRKRYPNEDIQKQLPRPVQSLKTSASTGSLPQKQTHIPEKTNNQSRHREEHHRNISQSSVSSSSTSSSPTSKVPSSGTSILASKGFQPSSGEKLVHSHHPHRKAVREIQRLRQRDKIPLGKRHCRPLLGGSPFLVCYECLELLQMPEGFHFSHAKMKLQCSSCFKFLELSLVGNTCIVPWSDAQRLSPKQDLEKR